MGQLAIMLLSMHMPSLSLLKLLSQKNVTFLQFDLSTRRKICSGVIVLHWVSTPTEVNDPGYWETEALPIHEGPTTSHDTEIPELIERWKKQ